MEFMHASMLLDSIGLLRGSRDDDRWRPRWRTRTAVNSSGGTQARQSSRNVLLDARGDVPSSALSECRVGHCEFPSVCVPTRAAPEQKGTRRLRSASATYYWPASTTQRRLLPRRDRL